MAIFSVFYNILQPNFAILLILGCSFELQYNDRFRLSCIDKKLVDSWNCLLHFATQIGVLVFVLDQ
jgi:hypothetical protein